MSEYYSLFPYFCSRDQFPLGFKLLANFNYSSYDVTEYTELPNDYYNIIHAFLAMPMYVHMCTT